MYLGTHLFGSFAIQTCDIRDIARIDQLNVMPRLLRILAKHSGKLVNFTGFGTVLGMNHITTQKYVGIFENLFIVRTLQSWYTNKLKRLTKSPKLHFLDSSLLAALQGVSPDRLAGERALFGPLLESFVFSELSKNRELV